MVLLCLFVFLWSFFASLFGTFVFLCGLVASLWGPEVAKVVSGLFVVVFCLFEVFLNLFVVVIVSL